MLKEILASNNEDAEARLLLATLWRHQTRYEDARQELDRLARLESAKVWQFEIGQERQRIAEAVAVHEAKHTTTEPEPKNESSSTSRWSRDTTTTGG